MVDRWPVGMTTFQYPFQVSTNSKEGSIKFSIFIRPQFFELFYVFFDHHLIMPKPLHQFIILSNAPHSRLTGYA